MKLLKRNLCPCGCGRPVRKDRKYASKQCLRAVYPATTRSKIKCKCGCGLYLSVEQAKKGVVFISHAHANIYNAKKHKGKVYNSIIKTKGSDGMINGKQYCKNYNNTSVKCVVCIEQALFKVKPCFAEAK